MSLSDISVDMLHEARVDLDHQIASLRERKLAIAKEIESRYPEPESESRIIVAQTIMPGFAESDAVVPSLGDPPRRRWWQT